MVQAYVRSSSKGKVYATTYQHYPLLLFLYKELLLYLKNYSKPT